MCLDRTRVLLLHPEDDPELGPWATQHWDRIVDLGSAGEQTRTRWGRKFGCPIEAIPRFEINEFSVVRRALSAGFDCVIDEHGLDWWELISIRFHEQIELLLRLKKLVAELASGNEVRVTRRGLHARILGVLLNREVECFHQQATRLQETRRLIGTARKFKLSQLIQILGDKYDAGYKIRRFTSRRNHEGFGRKVILMPVAQGNAARVRRVLRKGASQRRVSAGSNSSERIDCRVSRQRFAGKTRLVCRSERERKRTSPNAGTMAGS